MNINVKPREGKAVASPHSIYTTGIHHCVALILYAPSVEVTGLAHVFDEQGRFGADTVVESLLEEMIKINGQIAPSLVQAYLIGELDESLAQPGSRTERISTILDQRSIPILHKDVGGRLWRDVYVGSMNIRVVSYREDWERAYEEFHPEKVYTIPLRPA